MSTRRPWWCGGALIVMDKPFIEDGVEKIYRRTPCNNDADPRYGLCADCSAAEARQRADKRYAREQREKKAAEAAEEKEKRIARYDKKAAAE